MISRNDRFGSALPIIAFFLVTALTVSLFFPASHANAENAAKPILSAEDAEGFINTLLNEDAAQLDSTVLMTGPMEKAVSGMGGFRGLAQSLAALGQVESIGPAYEMQVSGLTAFRIPCRFQAMPLDLVLTTEAGAIAGLVTAEFTGNTAETNETAADPSYHEVSLSLPVASLNGELPGTLLLPESDGPFPAVILVHGSGPNDRDETLMAQKPFKDIAEGLAANGIASFRYDKRTFVYGAAMANDLRLTLKEETVDDAVSALQMLSHQEGIDPDRIFILGHSLGATAIPAIDQALKEQGLKACGYLLLAGSVRPLPELMKEQYDFLYSLLPEITETQQAEKDTLFAQLDRLNDLSSLSDDTVIYGAFVPYWRWLSEYDVLAAAEDINAPCLVLQGEEDYQVTMKDYALWENAFKESSNWQFISYPGLVHTFAAGQKTEGSAVYTRSNHVDPKVIEDIAQFIQSH